VCIRKWGTTVGLGELAIRGPLVDTILDPCGVVSFVEGTEIAEMECQSEWKIS